MAKQLLGTSDDKIIPGVKGKNTGKGPAIHGESVDGRGVEGMSTNNYGVRAHSDNIAGLRASSSKSRGLEGWGVADDGVWGISKEACGVHGISQGEKPGVVGESVNGRGVEAASDTNYGLRCSSRTFAGLRTSSVDSPGIESNSIHSHGILSTCDGKGTGVVGVSNSGIGIHGKGGQLAGFFEGDVIVTGVITGQGNIICGGADFAEDFDIVEKAEPGEVMVLTETGALEPSTKPYDKKVVGVISGAGDYKPGIILDKQNNSENRKPVAMMGKVYCKVDAETSPIETGDMLTTSHISGYAMKAIDPFRAFGAVLGKSLAPLNKGRGLIPILVVLQ